MSGRSQFYVDNQARQLARFAEVMPAGVVDPRSGWATSLSLWLQATAPDPEGFGKARVSQWGIARRGLSIEDVSAILVASRKSGMKPRLTWKDFMPEYAPCRSAAHSATA